MNTDLLRVTRLWTLIIAVAAAGGLAATGHGRFGLGVLGTAAWAVAGFTLVELLVRAALVPPDRPRPAGRIALLVAGKLALYGLGAWALLSGAVPPLSSVVGFSLLLGVLVAVAIAVRPTLTGATARQKGR